MTFYRQFSKNIKCQARTVNDNVLSGNQHQTKTKRDESPVLSQDDQSADTGKK